MEIKHSICELIQNSDITKKGLKYYISKGNKFALIMLYLGLTTPKCKYSIRHWWDEDGDGDEDICFLPWCEVLEEGNIFEADESEIEEVKNKVIEYIKSDEGKYQKILVDETNDRDILKLYADRGDEWAKTRYEFITHCLVE